MLSKGKVVVVLVANNQFRFKNLRNFPFHKIIIAMEKASQEPLDPILMNFGMKIVHEVVSTIVLRITTPCRLLEI